MEIFALKGHKVKVSKDTVTNGDSYDKKQVNEHLTVDVIYTIHHTDVHSWNTDVFLEEIPGKAFNSVMFESVTEQAEELSKGHKDWHKYN